MLALYPTLCQRLCKHECSCLPNVFNRSPVSAFVRDPVPSPRLQTQSTPSTASARLRQRKASRDAAMADAAANAKAANASGSAASGKSGVSPQKKLIFDE